MDIKLNRQERYAPFVGRENFGKAMSLGGIGVEVGTHRGLFAKVLLDTTSLTLFCVDPYIHGYDKTDPAAHGDRQNDKLCALQKLAPYGERAVLLEETSVEASNHFLDESVGFCYLDGCHQAEAVKEDLETWWPKIKKGGVLAGHDIICPGAKSKGGLGWGKFIRPVVNEFAKSVKRPVFIVRDSGSYWSYYLVK